MTGQQEKQRTACGRIMYCRHKSGGAMAYEIEDIKMGQEIFYYLLEHHELSEEAQEPDRKSVV